MMARVGIIGDTHCPGMLKGYPQFLRETFKAWNDDTVVHIGDLVDWAAISFHGKDPRLPAVLSERQAAQKQVNELQKAVPMDYWMLGNHDALPERQAAEVGLPPDLLVAHRDYWNLPDSVDVMPRFSRLEIDGVLYFHGDQGPGGMYAMANQAKQNFQSCVLGHLHALGGVYYLANHSHRVFGMNVGCGMDWELLQFEYGWKFTKKPLVGCGIVLDGVQAYWEPMVL